MKKIISVMSLVFLGSCFLGHPRGYRNVEIKNLLSPNLIIEGMEFRRIDKKIDGKSWGFFPAKYKDDPSVFIRISSYGIITPDEAREKEAKFQQIDRLKIYYKSKKCLLFYLNGGDKDIFNKYQVSFLKENILAITNNGLELLTPEQYESAKGKYTINDSNVKCIKE
jgi:hypothetical protein